MSVITESKLNEMLESIRTTAGALLYDIGKFDEVVDKLQSTAGDKPECENLRKWCAVHKYNNKLVYEMIKDLKNSYKDVDDKPKNEKP